MYSPHAGGHSPAGSPHSEISGSRPVSGSPELIAAIHVLRRLWLPRHPPYALCSLTLSLRHASRSRAGFDSRRISSVCTPFSSCASCIRYPWTIRIYSRRPFYSWRLFRCYLIFNEPWQGTPAGQERVFARPAIVFVELIGIEPTTSGLQSQRSPN